MTKADASVRRGRFIALEGGEGVGKSTQGVLLSQALRTRGLAPVQTREPGGTPGGEAIRALLLGQGQDWSARAEALLFAAARAEHVARVIRPALEAGQWVVCDRFLDSSRAYQGGEGGLEDADICELHRIGSGGLLPDCTILLTAPDEAVQARLALRDGDNSDRIGGRDAAFHRKVAQNFVRFAAAEPARFAVIEADGSPEEVHLRIMTALAPLLEPGA